MSRPISDIEGFRVLTILGHSLIRLLQLQPLLLASAFRFHKRKSASSKMNEKQAGGACTQAEQRVLELLAMETMPLYTRYQEGMMNSRRA
jgi:hypothetical protein